MTSMFGREYYERERFYFWYQRFVSVLMSRKRLLWSLIKI